MPRISEGSFGVRIGAALARALAVLAAAAVLALLPARAEAQCGGRWLQESFGASGSINGPVHATVYLPNGEVVIGGAFSAAGSAPTNSIARWTGSGWAPLGSGMNGPVYALAVMPNGDLIAGGDFTTAGAQTVNRIARWNGSAWSALGPGFNSVVHALAVLGNGDLVAGGRFTGLVGSVTINRVARWNGSGWAGFSTGANNWVYSLAVMPNGDLVAGGVFTSVGGTAASRIARWNGSAWSALAAGMDNAVYALAALPSGDLIAGGSFGAAGGSSASLIARWSGAAWSAIGAGITGGASPVVSALAVLPSGDLLIGGSFLSAGGLTANNAARLSGAAWSALGSGFNGPVNAFTVLPASAEFIAGGDFTTAGGGSASNVARWNGAAWTPEISNPGLNDTVQALAVLQNGDVAVGGFSLRAGHAQVNRIARWNGSTWSAFGSGVQNLPGGLAPRIYSLAVMTNGDLIAGGALFNTAGGVPARNIARWNGLAWSPMGSGMSGYGINTQVLSLAATPGNAVLAGGVFTTAGSAFANGVARWTGASWQSAGADLGAGSVGSVASLPNGDIIIAASANFNSPSGYINGVLRWDGVTWSQMGTAADNVTGPLAVSPAGEIYAVSFVDLGTSFETYLVRWSGSAWVRVSPAFNQSIYAIHVLPVGDVAVGGIFSSLGGSPTNGGLAIWRGGSSWTTSFNISGVSGGLVFALAQHPNGELLVGGDFESVGGIPAFRFARWVDVPYPRIAQQPAQQATPIIGTATFSVVAAPGYDFAGPLTYQWRRNGVNLTDGVTATGTTVSGSATAFLALTNISILDSGRYSVVVSNACGSTVSTLDGEPTGPGQGALLVVGDSGCPGDTTRDGLIDFFDLNIVLANYGATKLPEPGTQGDVTGDGVVDFFDLNLILAAYGTGC